MKYLGSTPDCFSALGMHSFVLNVLYDDEEQPYMIGISKNGEIEERTKFYFLLTFSREIKSKNKTNLKELGLKDTVMWQCLDLNGHVKYRIGKVPSSDTFFTYEQIRERSKKISYSEKLKALEWRERREVIIKREKGICEICHKKCILSCDELELFEGRTEVEIKKRWANIHHTYYVNECLPWCYPIESLKLLCNECHQNIHLKEEIKVYSSFSFDYSSKYNKCLKCAGSGYLSEYYYYYDGVCFRCDGTGYENLETEDSGFI